MFKTQTHAHTHLVAYIFICVPLSALLQLPFGFVRFFRHAIGTQTLHTHGMLRDTSVCVADQIKCNMQHYMKLKSSSGPMSTNGSLTPSIDCSHIYRMNDSSCSLTASNGYIILISDSVCGSCSSLLLFNFKLKVCVLTIFVCLVFRFLPVYKKMCFVY